MPEAAVIQAAIQLFSCVCHAVGYIKGLIFHWNQVVAVQSIHIYLEFRLMPSACYGCAPVTQVSRFKDHVGSGQLSVLALDLLFFRTSPICTMIGGSERYFTTI